MEGWVNTETLVGSLQTEAGIKSKEEIKSFLADFGVGDDIGTISTIFAKIFSSVFFLMFQDNPIAGRNSFFYEIRLFVR